MAQQKTYWHLLQQKRMPTEYEIVTSKLLCYTGEGFTGRRFELDVPLLDWYERFQQESPVTCTSWENFRDPRETTYTKYTEIQRDKEIFVDGILEEIEVSGYDGRFSPQWLHVLSRVVAPLRWSTLAFRLLTHLSHMTNQRDYSGLMMTVERLAVYSFRRNLHEIRSHALQIPMLSGI